MHSITCNLGLRKGPGRHDKWFRVICIWNLRQDGGSLMVRTFKERFLRFQLLFPDFYHFHHVIWGMKWAKKLKTKNGQNMSSGPFSHDAAQFWTYLINLVPRQHLSRSKVKRKVLKTRLKEFHQIKSDLHSNLLFLWTSTWFPEIINYHYSWLQWATET